MFKNLLILGAWMAIINALTMSIALRVSPINITVNQLRDPSAGIPPEAKPVSVVSGSVHDGDTLRVKAGSEELKVRLACVDAPELKQPGGDESRKALEDALVGVHLHLQVITTDKYGRSVAVIYGEGQGDLQTYLASIGAVYPYEQYADDCPVWDQVEKAAAIAKEKRIGVWADPSAVPPWDFRKNKV